MTGKATTTQLLATSKMPALAFNPNSNGLGRICPHPLWGLITLK